MTIDWFHFTPLQSLAGGALIGLAAAMMILINGRIAGVSGILGGLLKGARRDRSWRIAFCSGIVLSPLLYQMIKPLPSIQISANGIVLLISGFLVGLGTRYAAGCTSGHGVCGLSRLSVRSLLATLLFMFAGILLVYLTRHVLV